MNRTTEPKVLDLFAGCGGLSYGFAQAGFEIVGGIDFDQQAVQTYQKNFGPSKALVADLTTLTNEEIDKFIGHNKIDVIVGGPPCQGFSLAGKRLEDDPRNKLYREYLRIVRHLQPEAIVIENVPSIISLYQGRIANEIQADLRVLGYRVVVEKLNAADFGVPQNRRRVFFIAIKNGNFELGMKPHNVRPVTCREAIGDLPPLCDSLGDEVLPYSSKPTTKYQRKMRRGAKQLHNHSAVAHKEQTKQIISLVPDGGNYKDLPDHLQKTRKVNIAWTRMNSGRPCFTIDAGHNHHFHYSANRVPTVRECARIQSFPDDFVFLGNRTSQYRQVGNAVPPLLAEAVARKLKEIF